MGIIYLDLTCLKGINLTPLRRLVNIEVYSPVKGDTLLLCPELERDFRYHHLTVLFFLISCNKKFGSLWALV